MSNKHDSDPESSQDEQPQPQQGFIQKRKREICIGITTKLSIIIIIIIICFGHPTKPKFILQDATFFTFNLSTTASATSPPSTLLSSTLQITIASTNPNTKSGINYHDLGIYIEYKNQQITYQTSIPIVYQGHKETKVWSLLINGTNILISPDNAHFLTWDQSNRSITLIIKLDGHVNWKIGGVTTRKYHIHVSCNAILDLTGATTGDTNTDGFFVFGPVKYMFYRPCYVLV
ncbi:NDR1/HIN1-like protein 1 [Impatiens glandulifera]|uniref:NDR1/HIN1-like protein 1 n=1 Tax=Impatiens glandulifera TaxID=253017 RepID=UPI001FB14BB3|nr:NDR1/HIN1-like protein 1 [Impatiens glandulifera]